MGTEKWQDCVLESKDHSPSGESGRALRRTVLPTRNDLLKGGMRLSLLLLLALQATSFAGETVQVLFSPNGGCTKAIVEELDQAKKSVLVQAYSFTSAPIAKAVVDAHK